MANTIQGKLAYLEETKRLIKEAIVAKRVDVSDTDTFRSYADKIEAIQSGGGGGTGSLVTGTKLAYSTFSTIPDEYISYLEQQNSMYNMFCNCVLLQTMPLFDTNKCTDTSNMFNNCRSLETVPAFSTSNVTTMNSMFSGCRSLTTVPAFDTERVTDMSATFYFCEALETVPAFNTVNVTYIDNIFTRCNSLTNLGGFTGLKQDLDLHYSPLLTIESIVNIINAAADMTSSPRTLTLHQNVFNKLSQEQIAIETANAKGWNIASK